MRSGSGWAASPLAESTVVAQTMLRVADSVSGVSRVAMVVLAVGITACGSAAEPPPAPEPAQAPATSQRPAGRVVRVGDMPEGVVVDASRRRVAVALRNPARLVLLETASAQVVRRVRLPAAARHLKLARPGGPVLVPAESADVLAQVSLPDASVRTTRVGRVPHDATATAGRMFVGNEFADTVSVIEDDRVVRTLPAPTQPGGLAVPGAGLVATVGVRSREIELYDARTLRSLGRVNAGVGPTHVVGDDRGRLFVVDTQGDAVLMFRTTPRLALIDRVNVSGKPYGLAIDTRRSRLFVTTTATNRIVELRLRGDQPPSTVTSYPSVRQPNTLAVDAESGRLFIAGRAGGELQILDPRRP